MSFTISLILILIKIWKRRGPRIDIFPGRRRICNNNSLFSIRYIISKPMQKFSFDAYRRQFVNKAFVPVSNSCGCCCSPEAMLIDGLVGLPFVCSLFLFFCSELVVIQCVFPSVLFSLMVKVAGYWLVFSFAFCLYYKSYFFIAVSCFLIFVSPIRSSPGSSLLLLSMIYIS